MKKLLAVALLILPITSQALEQKDCISLHSFSNTVMMAKSEGVEMMDILEGFKGSQAELLTKVTLDAYSQTTYNSKVLNEGVAKNFASKWLGACMKAVN